MTDRERFELVVRTARSVSRSPDNLTVSASWTDGRDWEAGVSADGQGITVYYGPGSMTVDSAEEAIGILRQNFADKIVCVTALDNEAPVHFALAEYDDPTASFTRRDMPLTDHVMIRSWTGKRDRE